MTIGFKLEEFTSVAQRNGHGVIQKVKDEARNDAFAPNRQQTQDDPQERGVKELLEQAQEHVQEPEHQGRQQDGRASPMLPLQPGKNEAAKRELLADGGNEGNDDQAIARLGTRSSVD